jgi:hypothetical protein
MCDAYVDALDTGSTDAGADLTIHTAAFATLLATCLFAAPAFGDASNGIATANAIGDGTGLDDGTAAVIRLQDRDNTQHSDGTVTGVGSGGDLEITNLAVATDDTIEVDSGTVTMPAG